MAHRKRTTPVDAEPEPTIRKRVWLTALGFLLVEIAVLPGAYSPFRTPKMVLAVVVVLIVVGLSVAGALRRGRIELRWSPLATVLALLPVLQLLSAIWSENSELAAGAALHSAAWIAGALWIATLTPGERLVLVDGAAIGAAVSGVVLVAQSAGLALLSLGPARGSGRLVLTGLTGNPADIAMAAVLLLPLVLASPGAADRPRFRWTLAVLLTGAAVISQTLTALAALTLVWLIWLIQKRSRRYWTAALVVAVVVVGIGLSTGLQTRIQRQFVRLERGDWYFLLSARGDGWTAAGEMVRRNPAAGVGASNYGWAYYPSRIAWLDRTGSSGRRAEIATHFGFAHCDPLQMVAELGVPGALWIIAFVIAAWRHRPRGDPLPVLFAAAFAPFAFLHFPTHLAVGLVPVILALGHLLASGRAVSGEAGVWVRRLAPLLTVLVVIAGCYWQMYRLTLNLWRGALAHALVVAEELDEDQKVRRLAAVEAQILPRLPALRGAQPWLWRMVGEARLGRGDYAGAEQAFRKAMALWPHEEAEFRLGLTLAAQDRLLASQGRPLDDRNRRGEAIVHLGRVCRTNPALLELIDDADLRRSVEEIVRAAGGRPPRRR